MPRVYGVPTAGSGSPQTNSPELAISFLFDVHPVHFEDEVLVLLVGAEEARRLAGGDDLAVLHEEGAGMAIDVDPAVEVLAVEERFEAFGRRAGVGVSALRLVLRRKSRLRRESRDKMRGRRRPSHRESLLRDGFIEIQHHAGHERVRGPVGECHAGRRFRLRLLLAGRDFGRVASAASANRLRYFSSKASQDDEFVRGRLARRRRAEGVSRVAPRRSCRLRAEARLPSARAHSTNIVSLSPVSACSGVFVRDRFTHDASPMGASKTVSAGIRRRAAAEGVEGRGDSDPPLRFDPVERPIAHRPVEQEQRRRGEDARARRSSG